MALLFSSISSQISSPVSAGIIGSNSLDPSLVLDFTTSPNSDPRLTTTRASGGATYFDQTGTLQMSPVNTQRVDYGSTPGGVTNWIRNSSMQGAVVGGATPTFWQLGAAAGLSTQIVGMGTINGLNYIDVRHFGTPSVNGQLIINDIFDSGNHTLSAYAQTWTQSVYVQVLSDTSTVPILGVQCVIVNYGGTTTYLNGASSKPTASLTRISTTQTTSNTATTFVRASLWSTGSVSDTTKTYDVTVRLAAPQLEPGAVASTFIPSFGSVTTVGAAPLGLLIEEIRTNTIRNPRCEGAVAGTPGTNPTNWNLSTGANTTSIIGSGSENGIPYVDVQLQGSTSETLGWTFEPIGVIAALQNQSWTESAYCRLIAGSLSGVLVQLAIMPLTSGGGNLTQGLQTINPTTASLAAQRSYFTYQLPDATTAFVQPRFRITVPASAFNFTLRIGAPQLEAGTFVTSPILPVIGTPATTTRTGDVDFIALGTWWSSAYSNSVVVEGIFPSPVAYSQQGILLFDDGSANNRIIMRGQLGNTINVAYAVGGPATASSTAATGITPGAVFKAGAVLNATGLSVAVNGGSIVSSAGAAPSGTVLTTMRLGQNANGSLLMSGYIRKVRLWSRALSNSELQQLTT